MTSTVIRNITEVVRLKHRCSVPTELGLYAVVTKKNISHLDELIEWCVNIGLDYISLQLVYLPRNHQYYDQLVVDSQHTEKLAPVFNHLRSAGQRIRTPGNAFF